MTILQQLNDYMDTVIILTAIILALIAGIYIYLFRIRKITAKEERVNYDSFKRKDSAEFIKFQNILSEQGNRQEAMGIVDLGNHTYVGGIDIVGYNYDAASAEEQQYTMMNAIALANVIDGDVQFRQSVRAVDLGQNIEKFEEYKKNLQIELANLAEDYNEQVRLIEDNPDNVEYLKSLMEEADSLREEMSAKEWLISECELMLRFMTRRSDRDIDAQKINQLLYTYRFNPGDYTEELTEDDIAIKALEELRTMGLSYADAVSACGCRTSLLTADDFVGLLRQHLAPFGADDLTMEDMQRSSYNALFITSDSLLELERQKRDEKEYEKHLEELKTKRNDILRAQFTERERNKRNLMRETAELLGEGMA